MREDDIPKKKKSPFPFVEEGITPNDHPPSCVFLCARMDMSMDIHMDMSMDIHMEMPIKSKVSKLDGLYIQSEPAASRALRRWSNNPSAEGLIINDP